MEMAIGRAMDIGKEMAMGRKMPWGDGYRVDWILRRWLWKGRCYVGIAMGRKTRGDGYREGNGYRERDGYGEEDAMGKDVPLGRKLKITQGVKQEYFKKRLSLCWYQICGCVRRASGEGGSKISITGTFY